MMYWGWGWGMGLGMVLMVLFWVAIIGAAVWLLSRVFPRGGNYQAPPNWAQPGAPVAPPAESPLEIIKRRYASGEINKAEYEQLRQDLASDSR